MAENGGIAYHADVGIVEVGHGIGVGIGVNGVMVGIKQQLAIVANGLLFQWYVVPDDIIALAPALLEAVNGVGTAFFGQTDVIAPVVVAVEVDGVVANTAVDVVAFADVDGIVVFAAEEGVGKAAL